MKVSPTPPFRPIIDINANLIAFRQTENRNLKDETEIERALAFGEYIKNGSSRATPQRMV